MKNIIQKIVRFIKSLKTDNKCKFCTGELFWWDYDRAFCTVCQRECEETASFIKYQKFLASNKK